MLTAHDILRLELRGSVELEIGGVVAHRSPNLVCDAAVDMLLGLFAGEFDSKAIAYIAVGTGGDLNPATLLDTGARVAPQEGETQVRREIFRGPIGHVEKNDVTKEATFTSVAKPESANSDEINELGLLTLDGTMVAHYVTPADLSGRATRYTKDALLNMVTRWRITPSIYRG